MSVFYSEGFGEACSEYFLAIFKRNEEDKKILSSLEKDNNEDWIKYEIWEVKKINYEKLRDEIFESYYPYWDDDIKYKWKEYVFMESECKREMGDILDKNRKLI